MHLMQKKLSFLFLKSVKDFSCIAEQNAAQNSQFTTQNSRIAFQK